ncbi:MULTISPECIES: hypothetical protein [unclassified Mesorhizobium]|uniref:hypothetical protein n=1 Tax=unclassified Mesorhizobium TaxID=325217 RepID=UPI000BB07601|nr:MULTISPECIES: hypothetical protein [unclassified Mesorhizobium]TGT59844.1 hypothetical protein EN813_024960 [Mesorhizobium sp. M00.F.Ca.ET.170.01.1.1]PBB87047.1 hypothetical protein CK216_08760 [Mesorhizobium sp. WSM3876]RWB70278.1 MAG: hypothetical protein EOQ49_18210 [Mesorhizobium sp.]RWB91340.1 MAG: hypothetical protein EOQ52_07940 [Mesorhizobium sp.]RWE26868.1 MAG: hypothetical protein EOS41_05200 [Mesorhizobium sp.]
MRHVLSSLLALQWALIFALLAYICMDGSWGIVSAFGVLGGSAPASRFPGLEHAVAVALLASWVAVIAERRRAVAAMVAHKSDVGLASHHMAKSAANTSLPSRLSDRPDGKRGVRR